MYLESGNWKDAVNSIIKLKGIGVATASAIFAPFSPEHCPFMADEVIDAATTGKRDYNMAVYTEMRSALINKASKLGKDWNAELVGRALWIRAMQVAYPYDSKEVIDEQAKVIESSQSNKKRKLL